MQWHDRELPHISLAGSSSKLAQVMSLHAPVMCDELPDASDGSLCTEAAISCCHILLMMAASYM